jgi:hypothetical protein
VGHCAHKKEVESFGMAAVVVADHTVAAADRRPEERSWGGSSVVAKEQLGAAA